MKPLGDAEPDVRHGKFDDVRTADLRKECREFHLRISAQVADAEHDRLSDLDLPGLDIALPDPDSEEGSP